MRLKPLYRAGFDHPEGWSVDLTGKDGKESQLFLQAEGRVDGRISGRLRGANNSRRRADGPAVTDVCGVILPEEGGEILFEYYGYGRAYVEPYSTESPGRRQWMATAKHLSANPQYRWLNDGVCVSTGGVQKKAEGTPMGTRAP